MTMIYLNVIQRTTHKEYFIPIYLDLLKSYMNSHIPASMWFLNQFTNSSIIQEMFFENPTAQVWTFLSGLVYCAMLNVYKQEKKLLFNIFDEKSQHKPVLSNFINIVLSHLNYSKNFQEYFDSFHQILAWFASLGPEARLYLLKIKTIKRLCLFIWEYKWE